MRPGSGPVRHRLLAAAAPLALALVLAGPAAAAPAAQTINLPEGPLEASLTALAAQTGSQLLYAPELAHGRRAPALSGRFTTEQALQRLLRDGDVEITRVGPAVLVLRPRRPELTATSARTPADTAEAPQGLENAARPFVGEAPEALPATAGRADVPQLAPATVEEVKVTGSHIRGRAPGPSPLVVLGRDDLERTGQATVAGAVNTLPQAFGGESTEGTVTTRADRLGTNAGYGTGINLRGLGSDSTLVLVNGRRVAGTGSKGDFVDLSSLPAIAVARVEVLLDGASAVYGSDAVGGVVNVVLRRDLDGGEVRVRAGQGTRGEPAEAQVGLTFGRLWDTGGILLAYEAYARDALQAEDRPYTASTDLRPLGGSNWNSTFAFPGNITRVDPVSRATVPFWAIPTGQNGTGLTPASFTAGTTNTQNLQIGTGVLPKQTRQSAYLAASQGLGERLEVSGELRYAFRRSQVAFRHNTATLSVSRANPFFVSPNGSATHSIQYSFAGELPNPVARRTAENLSATAGGKLELWGDWRADGYLAFGQDTVEGGNFGMVNSAILAEALGNVADRPTTDYSPARDGYFNPFTGTASNPAAVTSAIGSGFSKTRPRSRVYTASLEADGTLLRLPGGPVQAALGVQARREAFRYQGANYTTTVAPVAISRLDGDRDVLAAFAEVRAPLVGPENARPGVEALELSAAIRGERYSDFGETFDPKLGLTWTPAPGLRLRGTYGQSFRAPALQELLDGESLTAIFFPTPAGQVLGLTLQGGNPTLEPETAVTWTAGVDAEPAFVPGLRLSATWYRTRFKGRIDRPVQQNFAASLTDPRFSPFVQRVSPTTTPADLAAIQALLATRPVGGTAGAQPAEAYGAIVDSRNVNTGILEVEGVDLLAGWSRDAWGGRIALGGSAAFLLHYRQALTPTAIPVDLAGQATYPAAFKARATADWTRGAVSLGAGLNHVGELEDDRGVHVDPLTTLDLQAAWRPASGRFSGLQLTVGLRNLFDADPPFYDNPSGLGYDPANAEPIGRFAWIQLARTW